MRNRVGMEEFEARLSALEDSLLRGQGRVAATLYQRLEALTGIYRSLEIDLPLPTMSGFALLPEVGAALVVELLAGQPASVVELGSGVSTLLCAYASRLRGDGHVYSLEHDEKYHDRTRHYLEERGLTSFVELFHAPLISGDLAAGPWQRYDLDSVNLPSDMDFLLIDGPPRSVQPLSRYPALPMLASRLSETAVVLLDDAAREDEQETIRLWRDEFPHFVEEELISGKGAVFLRRTRSPRE